MRILQPQLVNAWQTGICNVLVYLKVGDNVLRKYRKRFVCKLDVKACMTSSLFHETVESLDLNVRPLSGVFIYLFSNVQ